MIGEAYFQTPLTSITYVFPNCNNCKDYQLLWWQKCSEAYDSVKDHVIEAKCILKVLLFSFWFCLWTCFP